MRKWIALIAVIIVAAGALMVRHMMTPPDGLDMARSKVTEAGHFVVAVAPEAGADIPQGPMHNWIIEVKTPDGMPVEGAGIAIDGGMPQHGHGLPTAPQMTADLGQGRYRIEGVRFNMGGWWEFKLAITSGSTTDHVTFNLVL